MATLPKNILNQLSLDQFCTTYDLHVADMWKRNQDTNFMLQNADGHKHEDIIYYWNHTFLLQWKAFEAQMEYWSKQNEKEYGPQPDRKTVIHWINDKVIFYANNCTQSAYTKGEGVLLMISNLVSAKFG